MQLIKSAFTFDVFAKPTAYARRTLIPRGVAAKGQQVLSVRRWPTAKPRWHLTSENSEPRPNFYLPILVDIDVRFAPLPRLHQPPRPHASSTRDERRRQRILPACWFQSSLVAVPTAIGAN